MLTIEQVQAIMPQLSPAKGATLFPFLTAAVGEFAIDSPARTAAFLAQLAHESGQFRFMEEIWGPTAQQRRYEPPGQLASDLGNTEPGDGKRFKGRGPIQITGRANYRRFGGLLGLDLVAQPERAALPEVAFRIAGLFWFTNGLNELADQVSAEAFRQITRRINGGVSGLADRERFYETAKTVLGVAGPVVPRGAAPLQVDREETAFDRGHEAIRSDAARRRARKATRKKTDRKKRTAQKRRVSKSIAKRPAGKTRRGAGKAKAAARKRTSTGRSRRKTPSR